MKSIEWEETWWKIEEGWKRRKIKKGMKKDGYRIVKV